MEETNDDSENKFKSEKLEIEDTTESNNNNKKEEALIITNKEANSEEGIYK